MSLTALVYISLYVAGIIAAIFKRPIYGLHAYTLSFYAYAPGRWWGADLPSIRWAYIAALVTLISILIRKEKKITLVFFENKLFFIFVLYVIFQSLLIDDNFYHMTYVTLLIKFTLLIFIIQNAVENEKDLISYIFVNLLGCAYLGYLGITEFTSGRLEGIGTPGLESANQLGQHLGAVLVFSSFLLLIKIGKLKIIIAACVVLVLNAILLTESRGVLLALMVTGVVSLIFIPVKSRKSFIPYLVLGVIAGYSLIGTQMIEKLTALNEAENVEELDTSAASRFEIINAQIEMFKKNSFIGYGHRGTLLLSLDYIPEEYLTYSHGSAGRSSHNLTMAILVDHGIIGFFIYFLLIYSCFKKGLLADKVNRDTENESLKLIFSGLVLALLFFILAGQTSNNKVLELDIWLFALIPLVYSWIKNNKDQPIKPSNN
jgi:O-antigen ligase